MGDVSTCLPHVTLILRWRSWVGYELCALLVGPAFDVATGNAAARPVEPSRLSEMETKARLLYVGSSVVDGNRLNDGRGLPSPPSDSEEVDEARISTTEDEGRRCTICGTGNGAGKSLALER